MPTSTFHSKATQRGVTGPPQVCAKPRQLAFDQRAERLAQVPLALPTALGCHRLVRGGLPPQAVAVRMARGGAPAAGLERVSPVGASIFPLAFYWHYSRGVPQEVLAGAGAGPDAGAAAAGMLRRSDALLALESTQDDGLRLRKRCRKVREQAPGTAPVQKSPRSRLLWMFSLLHMKTDFKPVSQHLDSAVQTSGDGRTGNTEESCGLGRGAVLKVPQPTDLPVHLGQRFDHPEQQADQFLPLR